MAKYGIVLSVVVSMPPLGRFLPLLPTKDMVRCAGCSRLQHPTEPMALHLGTRDVSYCEPCAWRKEPEIMTECARCSECGDLLETAAQREQRLMDWDGTPPSEVCSRCIGQMAVDETGAVERLLRMAAELEES